MTVEPDVLHARFSPGQLLLGDSIESVQQMIDASITRPNRDSPLSRSVSRRDAGLKMLCGSAQKPTESPEFAPARRIREDEIRRAHVDQEETSRPATGGNRAIYDVLKAAHFAADRHSQQRRKGAAAEPYVNHLLEVAELVASALPEPDPNLIMAALLHDTVEDVGVTKEELIQEFGADVASLVLEVTDDKSLPKLERKRLQVLHAPKKSVRVQLIKLADKISNLRAVLNSPPADWSLQRRQEYFEWAKQVVDALSAPDPGLKAEFERLYSQAGSLATL